MLQHYFVPAAICEYYRRTPVVLVLKTGCAIVMVRENKHISAIINSWYGGHAAGAAIADVLFGNYHPPDRLPVW